MKIDRSNGLLVCAHCGRQQQPPALMEPLEVGRESSSACPACAAPLCDSRLVGFALLACARCGGMLIAMNQFATIIDAMRAEEPGALATAMPRRQVPDERKFPCPLCAKPMLSHIYGGGGNVVIETCDRCLVNWLDAGELRRIARAP
jgi:Zn-finger nucleic acid-binding protein